MTQCGTNYSTLICYAERNIVTDSKTIQSIKISLEHYSASRWDDPNDIFTPSAVLIPLTLINGEIHLVFNKRSSNLLHHKGEVSFPGGRLDPEDDSLYACALRETHEEMGLSSDQIEIIGQLDETPVISNYKITPFVGIIPHLNSYNINKSEIEYTFTVALDTFFQPTIHRLEPRDFFDKTVVLHFYETNGETIWGATGRIVTNFLHVCFDYLPPEYRAYLKNSSDLFYHRRV